MVTKKGQPEQRLQLDGTAWIKVGHRYLAPISYTSLEPDSTRPPDWIILGIRNVIPYDGEVIGQGEEILVGGEKYGGADSASADMRASVWGKSVESAVDILRRTQPDPAAAKYMDREPIDRYRAVLRDTTASEQPDARETGKPTIPMRTPR